MTHLYIQIFLYIKKVTLEAISQRSCYHTCGQKMKKKMMIMFLFIFLQLMLVNSFSPKHSSHTKPREEEINVMGFVYCDVCSNNTFSRHSYFMSGVEVRILCRIKPSSSTTKEMMTFTANRTTNEFGLYKVTITSLGCADVDSLASSCQASLVGKRRRRSFLDSSCDVPGYKTTTTDQVVFKSKRSNTCIFGFNALNFRPVKTNLALCGKK